MFLFIFTVIASFLIAWFISKWYEQKNVYKYWLKKGVEHLPGKHPVGSPELFNDDRHPGYTLGDIYKANKHRGDYLGLYSRQRPFLLATSPEFIKSVLVKDFQYFQNRGGYYNEKYDPLSANLFFLDGEKWRNMRIKLTPTFTSSKIKMMFATINAVADELCRYIEPHAKSSSVIEFKEILARFTTDVIGNCAFGLECNSLKDPDAEFRRYGKKVFQFSKSLIWKSRVIYYLGKYAKLLPIALTDPEVTEFFLRIVRETIDYRKSNKIERNDFMQLLINLKETGKIDDENVGKLTFEQVAAQAYLFFLAGFESSATTMTFALYLLSLNPDIQKKAKQHIDQKLKEHNGEFTYECLQSMDYIEKIVYETIRLFPPLSTITRDSSKVYKLPNGSTIPVGTRITIPVLGFHTDPDIFSDPEKFDPSRFEESTAANRHPFSFLPFGEGPRSCLGQRFGLLQTKLGLAKLIHQYLFETSDKTTIPVKVLNYTPTLGPEDVWLRVSSE